MHQTTTGILTTFHICDSSPVMNFLSNNSVITNTDSDTQSNLKHLGGTIRNQLTTVYRRNQPMQKEKLSFFGFPEFVSFSGSFNRPILKGFNWLQKVHKLI